MPENDKKLIAILVRHGDTEINEQNLFRSRLDPPLNPKGVEQAEEVAEAIAKENLGIKRVVCSPLLRACMTGDEVALRLGLEITQDRGLFSWALGFLSGKDKDVYEDILNFYIDNPKKTIPDGESLDDLEKRTYDFFSAELKKDLGVFVTHTSNIICVQNLIAGNHDGRPESGEFSVDPGGAVGIFVDEDGKYYTELMFGKEKEAQFGS
jgi:2,3-bisphosphoglycerate-dependent phosphoglycerate mutase